MCKIIVMANQKGGVAKTSSTRNLAYSLAELGKKVLAVDFDPQTNLTISFGVAPAVLQETAASLMMKLVMAFYEKAVEALSAGASLQDLINMPVREQIGRFKYVHEDDLDTEYEKVNQELDAEISAAQGKEGF